MKYTPKFLRGMLLSMIRKMGEHPEQYVRQPGRDFTRSRTLTFETVISLLRPEKTFYGCRLPGGPGLLPPRQHSWNFWHMNALFDLENGIYTDLIVQKEHEKNECRALCQMTDRSRVSGKAILLADRNYESCNNLAHLEKVFFRRFETVQ